MYLVHWLPVRSDILPCCKRFKWDVRFTDRITAVKQAVTCRGPR
jgi:hypothetical protein